MKNVFIALVAALTLASAALAVDINSGDEALAENLIGDWNCEYTSSGNGLEIIGRSTDSFVNDGSSFSHNVVVIRFTAEMGENNAQGGLVQRSLQFDVSEKARWEVKNKRLIRTNSEGIVNSVSDPELAELLGIDELDLSSEVEQADFIEVSRQRIKFSVANDSGQSFVVCRRQENII